MPTLGTGDVQVTLRWGSTADLDLAVNDPAGGQIDFENRTSPSGGQLDVDSNADCATAGTSPVENVFWPTGQAPDGQYRITVTYYDVCGADSGPQAYELTFKVAGADAQFTVDGIAMTRSSNTVTDAIQGVTHVIRGEDLAEAAHIHRLLQALLDLPTPVYQHHRLLTGPDGKKFSKRDDAQSLRDIRASGVAPEQLRAELGF